ncbi:MAG: glucose-6-phosphate isomerase, partial [Cyanobacteria bacterium]|nr:glucose-6-phosphate isomerase [Cyanobacteriota bacterium]
MITFHSQASDSRLLGADHGLPLAKVFQENGAKLNTILTQLYASKDEVGGWKKWMNLGENPGLIAEIKAYCASVKNQYDSLVILGIGGSSLGGFSLLKALLHPYWNDLSPAERGGFPKFYFLENVDSDQVAGLMDVLNPEKTLVNVITKSGTTAETMSAFMTFKAWLEKSLGAEKAANHIVATTDVKKGILREIANQEGYKTFEVPDDVGGRFSIFSAVGLLPAALCGISIEEILRGVNELDKVLQSPDLAHNPAAQNALIQYEMFKKGKTISVFMPYSYRLAPISDWYVQLWAESLGKKENLQGQKVYVGPTPVRAVGVTDQHSQVQLFNEGPFDK